MPDYRAVSGPLREAVRAFGSEQARLDDLFSFRPNDPSIDGGLVDPSSRVIDLAAASDLLYDEEGGHISLGEGRHRLVLRVVDLRGGVVGIEPGLIAEDGEELVGTMRPITENRVLLGNRLYRTEDLGPSRLELPSLAAKISRADLPIFLSIALSRFPEPIIRYGSYVSAAGRPRIAGAALIFKEIDEYGYLHVKPCSFLSGYPQGFFEEQDVVKVVEIDDDEKRISVSEVIFPVFADDEFRGLLSAYGKEAKAGVYEEAGRFILEPRFAELFITERMGDLVSKFVLFESKVLARYKLRAVFPKLRISMGKGIDYLEGRAEVVLDDQVISYGRFLAAYRKNGFVTLSDGSRAFPDAKAVARFERLISRASAEDAVEVSIFDFPALTRDAEVDADGGMWKQAEAFYRGMAAIADRPFSCTLPGTYSLRPYQEYGVKWLEHLRDHAFGGCLADEMGLGKTVQVISLLKTAYTSDLEGLSVIVMPRSLIFNWEAEFRRFAPEIETITYYGAKRDAKALEGKGKRVVLTSYATLRNDIEDFKKMDFGYVVLDESQSIKNTETQTTAAVLKLKARHRLALSGTPVENNLGELYSLFRFLNPGFFGSAAEFSRAYLKPIQDENDEDALRDLKARIYPFMLRRLKRDVLLDLPEKTEQTAYIELDPAHLAIYHRRREELRGRVSDIVARQGVQKGALEILQALTELRRLAGIPESDGEYAGISAKREYLKEMVAEIVENGHKCLIFTNFIASVELIAEDLEGAGIGTLVMTGATGDRQSLVNRFQSDDGIRVFVMTLKTGGVGLNLTAADYVFIFDPWWNRSAEAQAVDRTHRIGQTNPVFCYRMIAKDTIEEKMLELQERKAGLVASLLSADAGAVKALDESDIEYLLG